MPTRRLRRATARAAAAVTLAAAAVAVIAPAHAADPDDGYYGTSYSTTVYRVVDGTPTAVTYAQWVAAGSPTPKVATVTYRKFSWDPTIYRQTYFGAWPQDRHQLTAAEWVAAGRPTPTAGDLEAVLVYRWGTSDELFATTPDGVVVKLTARQWQEIEDIAPIDDTDHLNAGFIKLSWSGAIAFGSDLGFGGGAPITYARWAAEGYPTPRVARRFPGDQFYRHKGSSTIYYAGPTMNRAVTHAEWVAAGSPTPTVT